MEEAKFNNLCSHYKDTFDIHRESIKYRDRLFYGLLIILALFTIQFFSADMIVSVVIEYINKESGIKISTNANFISTLLWLLLLGFSTRYFQVVLEIERQYEYLHILEQKLNSFYPESKIFTREGKFYLSRYPLFSNWIWFLYTIFFPVIIILFVSMRIKSEFMIMNSFGINQLIDLCCYILVGASSVLYIYRLHELIINDFTSHCIRFIRRYFINRPR